MKLFPKKNRRKIQPDETPLGPKTYPKVGGRSKVMAFVGRRRWLLIGSGLLGILLIVFIVLLIQRSGGPSIEESVLISLEGPEKVTLGSDVSYDVKIINAGRENLSEASLLMLYPNGFSFTSSDPKASNGQGTQFNLDQISVGDTRELKIDGRLTGAIQEEQTFIARLQFKPENSQRLLQVEATTATLIETAAFSLEANVPENSLPNNALKITASFENNESTPLSNLQLRVTYPGTFDFQNAEPAPSEQEHIWSFASLGIGEKKNITINGVLGGNPGEILPFVFEAGILDDDGNFLKQTELEKVVKINQAALTINQTVNEEKSANVSSQETLEYEITFENTGATGLANLALEVRFDPGAWDISTLSIKEGGALESGNVIKWDGVTVPTLRNIDPREKGEVHFNVKAPYQIAVGSMDDKNFSTTSTPRILIGNSKVEGNPVSVKYRAGITPAVSTQVKSGPNPPQTNKATIYTVTWTLNNSYNDLTGGRYVGKLPPSVEFVKNSGHVSVGEDIVFRSSSREIIWNIGNVPANIGILQPTMTATFEIRIFPQANEIGSKKLILTAQQFTAHDTWANEDRSEDVDEVKTVKILQ